MLSYTHAGLYYVYYIVAEFLAFLDDIHIHGTDGVGIEMVVYIVDVLALQHRTHAEPPFQGQGRLHRYPV
jgi:hypothetical protein